MENSKNLQDKDQYRKQIREMGERYDELQVQLFRTQGEVLALQSKLRKQKNPIQVVCTIEIYTTQSDHDMCEWNR